MFLCVIKEQKDILVDDHGHALLTMTDLAAVHPDWLGIVDLDGKDRKIRRIGSNGHKA